MLHQLSPEVFFGDKPSLVEAKDSVRSVVNVAHRIRKPYWDWLSELHHDVWYFKLALPDREIATDAYCAGFCRVVDAITIGEKLPLLCHCRMGGHRGPTAALFAYWHLNGRTKDAFETGLEKLVRFSPNFMNPTSSRVYRNTVIDYCMRSSA